MNFLKLGCVRAISVCGCRWAGGGGRFRSGDVPVTLFIKGQKLSGRARTVMDDPWYTRDVFERLRPNVPKWLPLVGRLSDRD